MHQFEAGGGDYTRPEAGKELTLNTAGEGSKHEPPGDMSNKKSGRAVNSEQGAAS